MVNGARLRTRTQTSSSLANAARRRCIAPVDHCWRLLLAGGKAECGKEDKRRRRRVRGSCGHARRHRAPPSICGREDGTAPGLAAGQVNGISSTCRLKAGRAAMRAYQASSAGMAGRFSDQRQPAIAIDGAWDVCHGQSVAHDVIPACQMRVQDGPDRDHGFAGGFNRRRIALGVRRSDKPQKMTVIGARMVVCCQSIQRSASAYARGLPGAISPSAYFLQR